MSTILDRPPPPAPERGGGGGHDWVELFRAHDDIDAHLLVGRLEEAGIESRCVKDRRAPGAWLYGGSNPWAPVTVYVRRYQLVDARLLLADLSLEADAGAEVTRRTGGAPESKRWWIAVALLGVLITGALMAEIGRALDRCDVPIVCSAGDN